MPAFSKLNIAALDDLARQLRFAPAETLRRQLERTRELAAEIDPKVTYPEDWVVFRITGYRPEIAEPAAFAGAALLADACGLVERISAAAKLRQEELDAAAYLEIDPLCVRWGVSRKTVERWRRMGLVALRVRGKQGKPRLLFPIESVERFERLEGARVGHAAGYSRIGPDLEERMLRRAAAYAKLGCTLNQSAGRIARRYGRAVETVRQLLKRSDAGRAFAGRGPASAHKRELIARGSWLAVEPAELARRLGRTVAAVRRVADDERTAALRRSLGVGEGPVVLNLGRVVPEKGGEDLLRAVAAMPEPRPRTVIVGPGPYGTDLRRIAGALGVPFTLVPGAEHREVGLYLSLADVFVMPTRHQEGLPFTLVEAMMARRPVVACDIGGVSEIVRHQQTGLLVGPGDIAGLSAAMLRMLREPDLARRLADAGRALALERFSLGAMVDATLRVLRAVRDGGRYSGGREPVHLAR